VILSLVLANGNSNAFDATAYSSEIDANHVESKIPPYHAYLLHLSLIMGRVVLGCDGLSHCGSSVMSEI
jgi:hypothetical protein